MAQAFSSAPSLDLILGAIAACYSTGDREAHQFLDSYRESQFAWQGIHELLSCTQLPPGLPSHLTLLYVHHFSSTLALNKVKADWKAITDENEKQNVRAMFLFYLKARCATYVREPSSVEAAIIANIASSLAMAAVYDKFAAQLCKDALAMVHDSLFATISILTAVAQCRDRLHLPYARLNALNMELASVATEVFDLAEQVLVPLTALLDPASPLSLRSLAYKHPANHTIPALDTDLCPVVPLRAFLSPPATPPPAEAFQGSLASLLPPTQTIAVLELLSAWTPIAASPAALLTTSQGLLLPLLLALLPIDAFTEQAGNIISEALTLQSFPKPASHDIAVDLITASLAEWSVRVLQRSFVAHMLPDTPTLAPAMHHSAIYTAGLTQELSAVIPAQLAQAMTQTTQMLCSQAMVTLPASSSYPDQYADAEQAEIQMRVLANIATTLVDNETFTIAKGAPAAVTLTNAMLILLAHPLRTKFATMSLDYFIALQAVPMQNRSHAFTGQLFLSVFVILVLQLATPGSAIAWVIRNIDSVCVANKFPERLFSQYLFSTLTVAKQVGMSHVPALETTIAAYGPETLRNMQSLANPQESLLNTPTLLNSVFDAAEGILACNISLIIDSLLCSVQSHHAAADEDEDAVAMLCGQVESVTGDLFAILEENSIHVLLAAMGATYANTKMLVSLAILRPLPAIFADSGADPSPAARAASHGAAAPLSALEQHYIMHDNISSLAITAASLRCLIGMAAYVEDILEDCQCAAARLELSQSAYNMSHGHHENDLKALQEVTEEYKKHGFLLQNLLSPFLEHILDVFSRCSRERAAKSPLTPIICKFLSSYAFLLPLLSPHLILRLLTLLLSLSDAMTTHIATPAPINTYSDLLASISPDPSMPPSPTSSSPAAAAASMASYAQTACTASLLPLLAPMQAFQAICRESKSLLLTPHHPIAPLSPVNLPTSIDTTPRTCFEGFLALFTPSHLALACPSTATSLPFSPLSPSPLASSVANPMHIYTAAPLPSPLSTTSAIALPLGLPAASLHALTSAISIVLRGLPSSIASGIVDAFSQPVLTSLNTAVEATKRCPMSSLPNTLVSAIAIAFCSSVSASVTALAPLFFQCSPPNLDAATGVTISAFGKFEEDGNSLRSVAMSLHNTLWPTLESVVLLVPSLSNIPAVYQDLTELSQRATSLLNVNAHFLPAGLKPHGLVHSLSHALATPARRLSASIADCLHAVVTSADTTLAPAIPTIVSRVQDLYCSSVIGRSLYAPVLRVLAAALDVFGEDIGTHAYFSSVLVSVVKHTYNIVSHTANDAAYTHLDALTQVLKLIATTVGLRPNGVLPSGKSWQQASNYSLYGAAWMHVHDLLPNIYFLITVAMNACATERELSRYVLDVSASVGVSLCRDAQVHYLLSVCNRNQSTTTIDDDGLCTQTFYNYAYSEQEWTFNQALHSQLPSYSGEKAVFWVQNGQPNASSEAVSHVLIAFVNALAGHPDLPQELYNKTASAILGLLASAPAQLQQSWAQNCLASPVITNILSPHIRAQMSQVLCICAAKVSRGDVYGQERKFRMMIRDFAAALRSPGGGFEALEDYLH